MVQRNLISLYEREKNVWCKDCLSEFLVWSFVWWAFSNTHTALNMQCCYLGQFKLMRVERWNYFYILVYFSTEKLILLSSRIWASGHRESKHVLSPLKFKNTYVIFKAKGVRLRNSRSPVQNLNPTLELASLQEVCCYRSSEVENESCCQPLLSRKPN